MHILFSIIKRNISTIAQVEEKKVILIRSQHEKTKVIKLITIAVKMYIIYMRKLKLKTWNNIEQLHI